MNWIRKYFSAADIFSLLTLGLVGYFICGFLLDITYLVTGYQDWIFHAFRIEKVMERGITSWDHVWANGLNIWYAYHYFAHLMGVFFVKAFSLSVPDAMIAVVVFIFIFMRIAMYLLMRMGGVNTATALLITLASYSFNVQWGSFKDYAIYVSVLTIPVFMFTYIQAYKKRYLWPVVFALCGAFWSVHPVSGVLLGGLAVFSFFVQRLFRYPLLAFCSFSLLILGMVPYLVSYFMGQGSFSAPLFSSYLFAAMTVSKEYFGFSLVYYVLCAVCAVLIFMYPHRISAWSKHIFVYSMIYWLMVIFTIQDLLPKFLTMFQFHRGMLHLAFILPFAFAGILAPLISSFVRLLAFKTVYAVLLVVMLIFGVQVVDSAFIVKSDGWANPAVEYLKEQDLRGSVYVANVSEATYLSDGKMRFVNGYNDHYIPSPLSLRIGWLTYNEKSFTGISSKQISLINDFATVLGIEYIVVPESSAFDVSVSRRFKDSSQFEKVERVGIDAILKNKESINYAYLVENSEADSVVGFEKLAMPTLLSDSYAPWEQEVSRLAEIIREGKQLVPVEVKFSETDTLEVVIPEEARAQFRNPGLLLHQSWDRNWNPSEQGINIRETSLRFMYITSEDNFASGSLRLENRWPWWYWYAQALGLVAVGIGILFPVVVRAWGDLRGLAKKERASQVGNSAPAVVANRKKGEIYG